MLNPFLADWLRIEVTLLLQSSLIQQSFGPLAQRAAQPGINRHAESHFGTFDQFSGNVTIKHLTKDPLTLSPPDFILARQTPGEFQCLMVIQEGRADFKAVAHAGAVHFIQNIAGEISDQVEEHHLVGEGG